MGTIAHRAAALLAACLIAGASLFAAGAASAQSPGPALASRLVGHWSLVSAAIGDQHPYGPGPQGSMFFDAAGHFSVVVSSPVARPGRAGGIGYFGEYKVDEAASVVTIHIDASTRPGAAGRDERRIAALDGDTLTLKSGQSANGLGTVTLVWKRAD